MYERVRVNVKIERGSTFTIARDLPYIASILFTRVKFTCVRACARKNYQTVEIHPNAAPPAMFLATRKRFYVCFSISEVMQQVQLDSTWWIVCCN